MTYTQEQINGMSRFEVNKAVAEKLDYTGISSMTEQESYNQCGRDSVLLGRSKEFRPTSDPSDYMPVAIEYGISTHFGHNESGKTVFCTYPVPKLDARSFGISSLYPRTDTSLAVCAAFLMMEVDG